MAGEVTARREQVMNRKRYYGPLSPRRAVRHLVPWWIRWLTGFMVVPLVFVTACSSSPQPSVSACRAAMQAQYKAAMSSGKSQGAEPPVCKGADDADRP